jgi:hypothetical protein
MPSWPGQFFGRGATQQDEPACAAGTGCGRPGVCLPGRSSPVRRHPPRPPAAAPGVRLASRRAGRPDPLQPLHPAGPCRPGPGRRAHTAHRAAVTRSSAASRPALTLCALRRQGQRPAHGDCGRFAGPRHADGAVGHRPGPRITRTRSVSTDAPTLTGLHARVEEARRLPACPINTKAERLTTRRWWTRFSSSAGEPGRAVRHRCTSALSPGNRLDDPA